MGIDPRIPSHHGFDAEDAAEDFADDAGGTYEELRGVLKRAVKLGQFGENEEFRCPFDNRDWNHFIEAIGEWLDEMRHPDTLREENVRAYLGDD